MQHSNLPRITLVASACRLYLYLGAGECRSWSVRCHWEVRSPALSSTGMSLDRRTGAETSPRECRIFSRQRKTRPLEDPTVEIFGWLSKPKIPCWMRFASGMRQEDEQQKVGSLATPRSL